MSRVSKTTLGELIEFQRGFDLPKSSFIKGIYPVRSSNGILGYHNEYKVKGPGITIGRSGTVGIPHLIKSNFYPHNTSLFIKDFKGNDIYYIYYLLKYLKLGDKKSGSGVPTMNRNHLHPLNILAYLDNTTQKSIAKVLSDLDAKIALNNKINQELEAMAKTLYDYWFVQFDFPNQNGKPYKSSGGKMVYNEELKREIPEGWEVGKYGEYSSVKSGFAFKSSWWSDKGVPVLKIKDIEENYILNQSNFSFINKNNISDANRFKSKEFDVVIAMTGATIGKFCFIPKTDFSIYINQRVGLYDLGKNPIDKLPFLFNSMKLKFFREKIFQVATGAAQPNISGEQLDNFPLIKPPKKLIDIYNEKFKSTYKRISNNTFENQYLTQLRDWLLPMLMNGQVQVASTAQEDVLGMVAEPVAKYGKDK